MGEQEEDEQTVGGEGDEGAVGKPAESSEEPDASQTHTVTPSPAEQQGESPGGVVAEAESMGQIVPQVTFSANLPVRQDPQESCLEHFLNQGGCQKACPKGHRKLGDLIEHPRVREMILMLRAWALPKTL